MPDARTYHLLTSTPAPAPAPAPAPDAAVHALIAEANEVGGSDNVRCVMADVVEGAA
ncbi:hypothetical protein [Streptomyces europaeiscabiei]|uniref:hypothetical protein n=1 Tax=Streptomyces europaeiscabiei TaxID=146819 RepID=UPI003990846F